MTEKYLEELIQKYADGTANEEEIKHLMNWYDAMPNEIRWPGEKKEVQRRIWHRLHAGMKQKERKVLIFPWQKIAAAILVILGIGFLFQRVFNPPASSYVTVLNPSGKIKELHLPDGSIVWLNAQTELRYANNFLNKREVELKGEAYFEVIHDTAHPFRVSVDKLQTIVLGTRFNIKGYDTEKVNVVSLISGSVKVSNIAKDPAVLKPSTQLIFDKVHQKTTIVSMDTSSVLAWKNGRLQFEGESLENIAATLERWYSVHFVFANSSIKKCRYYMGFNNSMPLQKTLSIMAELTGMKYSIDKNVVTLSGKGCE